MEIKMKNLVLVFFLTQSINALADDNTGELTHFIELRNIIAAVAWDDKNGCSFGLTTVITTLGAGTGINEDMLRPSNCSDSDESKFYSPTALIFKKKTGGILRAIRFFNEECPYKPVALSITGNKLTMTVKVKETSNNLTFVGTGLGEDIIGDKYENCQYPDEATTIRETRNLKTGKLIKQIVLQDHRAFNLP